jgi:hypothetical protein
MMLFFPVLLQAQEATTEITAFGAYRFGGTFEQEASEAKYELKDSPSFGLILNIRHQDPTQWEIFYSQQQTEAEFIGATANDPEVDIDLHVLQLGGTRARISRLRWAVRTSGPVRRSRTAIPSSRVRSVSA